MDARHLRRPEKAALPGRPRPAACHARLWLLAWAAALCAPVSHAQTTGAAPNGTPSKATAAKGAAAQGTAAQGTAAKGSEAKGATPNSTAAEKARQTARRATTAAGAAAAATATALALADEDQRQAYSMTHLGDYACEFKRMVQVIAHPTHEGYVNLHFDRRVITAKPVLSSTGAIRLEDVRGQFMMLQIAYKSMLMDVRKGQRVADECLHDRHIEAREAAQQAPKGPGLGISTTPHAGVAPVAAAGAASAATGAVTGAR